MSTPKQDRRRNYARYSDPLVVTKSFYKLVKRGAMYVATDEQGVEFKTMYKKTVQHLRKGMPTTVVIQWDNDYNCWLLGGMD